ncbi:MAG: hypothetical protein HY698_14060 [Deltaproteobacteria bacterium]|nr:hypothetical protein [Deltaproteobacteria bacterium]
MQVTRHRTTTLGLVAFLAACSAEMGESDEFLGEDQLASSVHLKGGKNAEPSFIDNGLTLTGTADLAGLGEGDILITINATANPTAVCTNPSGANQPPGQNPAPVNVTGSASFPQSQIKNGSLSFSVTTQPPASPVPGAPDCPSSNWTETITDMRFTSATITVQQAGTTVLTVFCSFSPQTSNGLVPSGNVTCTSL